jgi:hypothetical protein
MANAQSIDESKEILQQEIETVSKLVKGKQIDFMTTCIDILFDGKDIIYFYKIDESDYKLSDLDFDAQKEAQTLILNNTEAFDPIMKHLRNVGGKLVYVYIGNVSYEVKSIAY